MSDFLDYDPAEKPRDVRDILKAQEAEIGRLRAALQWYANPYIWGSAVGPTGCGPVPAASDRGDRARKALANEGK